MAWLNTGARLREDVKCIKKSNAGNCDIMNAKLSARKDAGFAECIECACMISFALRQLHLSKPL